MYCCITSTFTLYHPSALNSASIIITLQLCCVGFVFCSESEPIINSDDDDDDDDDDDSDGDDEYYYNYYNHYYYDDNNNKDKKDDMI